MDSANLKAASAYINNLLLARGLLRNGKNVEFARPSKGEGGTEATMAQIINLVHDMILRRDKEQEQKESLAQTLRTLRTESTRNTVALDRLQTRNDDLARQLSLAQSQERSARAALKTAEISARALREEMARTKATVQQIRTACANDVRKRDVQIQRLKTHLTTQQRGNKTGLMGASITISPSINGMATMNASKDDSPDVEDAEYNLRQETTDFLTQLSQSLSDENDNLIGLVRTTLTTLREVQGLPENMERAGLPEINEEETGDEHMLHALPTSYDALDTDMHNVLDNLRSLLTNPNFVPIEEVSLREEEILRLRAGWEMMEQKWREAILMMDGWRKRMLSGGHTVNIEELKLGLGLGAGLSNNAILNGETSDNEDIEINSLEDAGSESGFQEDVTEELNLLPEVDVVEEATRKSRDQSPRSQKPLQETNGNASPRKVAFASKHNSPAVNEAATAKAQAKRALGTLPTPSLKRPTSTSARQKSPSSKDNESRIPRKTLKRLSSPGPHAEERSPKLTTQEKLNIAQAEAEAAAVKAGVELEDLEVQFEGFEEPEEKSEVRGVEKEQEVGAKEKEKRKTRIGGRARRRKSTLTPEELEKLMFD